MRRLSKLECPQILLDNADTWLAELLDDPDNQTKKIRYRAKEIKECLKDETSAKCAYCESKIGHNTPGDIEHKLPVKHFPSLRYDWENLTVACTECNRRKSDYWSEEAPFLDPYHDDVEEIVLHLGPIVTWQPGNARAEICIRTLDLNSSQRLELVVQKIQKMIELDNLMERYITCTDTTLKELVRMEILKMAEPFSEFSGMVKSALIGKKFLDD